MTRREMLRMLVTGAVSLTAIPVADALALAKPAKDKTPRLQRQVQQLTRQKAKMTRVRKFCTGDLSFYSAHTDEFIKVRYLNKQGQFDPAACKRLNHFFRCHYTGQVIGITPGLFMLLDAVHSHLGAGRQPYVLYSGYRSPAYNRLLARNDSHVARNSYHLKGMAADVALDGVRLSSIAGAAKVLGLGGVGRYDDFVHVDLGPVRCW